MLNRKNKDNSGTISEDEWIEFWNSVKRSGHTEEEISEEVNNFFTMKNYSHS